MKVALIPPVPELKRFGQGDFHLLLTHLFDNSDYVFHYRLQKQAKAYLVLDNSAHEFKRGLVPERLLAAAWSIQANEMVMPDVLFKGTDTIDAGAKALDWLTDQGMSRFEDLKPRIMLVPQGADRFEYYTCLSGLIWKYQVMTRRYPALFDRPPVIGVSKDYEIWEGGIEKLFADRLERIHNEYQIDVHLLGWGRELWRLGELADAHPWIRSTDSAKPFVYGSKYIDIDDPTKPPEYPTRDESYFRTPLDSLMRDISDHNVAVFKGLARAG